MRQVVGGLGRRGGAVGSAALEQAMQQVQDGEGQAPDGRGSQWLDQRPMPRRSRHQNIIHQFAAGVEATK